ncbi:MAG: phosphodiester glycosidase family protein [Ignavibacteria bacterium]|nr:phosphodiester glycosidase family protein [Ignavibacteria bacterium]
MLKKSNFFFVLIFLASFASYGQSVFFPNTERELSNDSLEYFQVRTDTLLNSKQVISFLVIPKTSSNKFHFEISYNKPDLMTTSSFGEINNAAAALNGSYFDMDSIAGVCYLEVNDSVINRTRTPKLKWAKPDSIINGVVVITKENRVLVMKARSEKFYEASKAEKAVLVSGPLLLYGGQKTPLADMKFVTNRHPRTFLCTTENDILFIAVDGRSSQADGMNLIEAQDFLISFGCEEAINLDGGGSTTLWIKGEGVINNTSDLTGERPVSNAILIMKNEK